MKAILISLLFAALPISSSYANGSISDAKKIKMALARIPVTDKDLGYKDLNARLPKVGMSVEFVKITKVAKGEDEPPYIFAGDEIIDIFLSEPNQTVKAICPISGGQASYVIRGKKIIPQTRTAHWLMTNKCDYKG
ncbi:hypothetical protein [Janthinobacterium sp. LB2P70]|uniref:hypothetical protein n=1 Tax=Janthinobacterium sp. LB2P70 TaxID=3424197 RepID=UPI003F230815